MLVKAHKSDHLEAYREQGFFILRNIFSAQNIAEMRERLEALIRGEFAKEGRRFQPETDTGDYAEVEKIEIGYRGPDVPYRKIADLEYDEVFLRNLQNPMIQEVCQELMGNTVSLMRMTMMDKAARGGTALPWHQDVSLDWPTDIQPSAAIWFPLDIANKDSGSLQVIPGSHHEGIIGSGHMLPPELEPYHAPENKIVTAELLPGDCLFFHAALLHRSGINISDEPRRAINAILMPGECLHTKRNCPYPVLFGKNQLNPNHVSALRTIPR